MADSLADADFELLLRLNSVTDAASEFLETRWVNEQEVTLESLSVDFDCAFDVDLDDRNLSVLLDALQLLNARSVPAAWRKLTVLDKLFLRYLLRELRFCYKIVVLFSLLISLADLPGSVRLFAIKDVAVFLQNKVNQSALADA